MARSKRNQHFLTFVNRKYREDLKKVNGPDVFYTFDDYALYLYYELYKEDVEVYYYHLEKDLREYVNIQMGIKPRTRSADGRS